MINFRENRKFFDKVRNFPVEVYRLDDENTKIYQLMYALLEIGVATPKRLQEAMNVHQQSLANTRFYDLDVMYGDIFRIYRLTDEIYTYNPYADALTQAQWLEIEAKDSQYRHRIALLLSAFQYGGSPQGIAMVAEAACGIKCDVFEVWRDDISAISMTNSPKEFVIVPRAAKGTVRTVSFQDSGDTVTLVSHGLNNGTNVRFTSITSTTGITVNTNYYVINASTDTFQLASTLNGSALPLTTNGSGTIVITIDGPTGERIITDEEEASIINLVNLFKPVNTICNVIENTQVTEVGVNIPYVSANSEGTITRTIIDTHDVIARYVYTQYEDEFCLNDEIPLIDVVEQQNDYIYQLGSLINSIISSDTSMDVLEINAPSSPVFYCKIDDEIVLITDRVKLGTTANEYTYQITRAQEDTVADAHSSSASIMKDFVSLVPESPTSTVIWNPWIEVGLADSPDNFPNGKYPSKADRYDKRGNYIYEYKNQEEYIKNLLVQLKQVNGQGRVGSTIISSITSVDYNSHNTPLITHYRTPLYTSSSNPLIIDYSQLLVPCTSLVTTRVIL